MPYKDCSEIISSYYEHLTKAIEWYYKFGKINGKDDNGWFVREHTIAQYNLMREILPEDLWADKSSWIYRVDSGTNIGGRPWTEVNILEAKITLNEYYRVFWRIDSDNKGIYISLRFYDKYDKKSNDRRSLHTDKYELLRKNTQSIFDNAPEWFKGDKWDWETVKGGYTGNYYETTLLTHYLNDDLENWEIKKTSLIERIRYINDQFLVLNEREVTDEISV